MDTTHTSPLPPRGERFSDPAARAANAAVAALPVGSQALILDELRERLGRIEKADSHHTRVRHAISALRECAELLDHSPSVAEYRAYRLEHPELTLPADSSIRTWLGGTWNDCLRQAHLQEVTDGDVVVVQMGAALTEDEVCAAVRLCAEELGEIPTFHRYLHWVKKSETKAKPGRRPASLQAFTRLFGGFTPALIKSGLIDGKLDGLPRSTRVRLGSYWVDESTCIAALKEVAERLGHSPRVAEYKVERERVISEPTDGVLRTIPAATSIQHRFESWDKALIAAGLQPLGGRATSKGTGPKGPRFSLEDIVSALITAAGDCGEPFTGAAYREWRRDKMEHRKAWQPDQQLPSYDTICSRLGGWNVAVSIVNRGFSLMSRPGSADNPVTTAEILEGIELPQRKDAPK